MKLLLSILLVSIIQANSFRRGEHSDKRGHRRNHGLKRNHKRRNHGRRNHRGHHLKVKNTTGDSWVTNKQGLARATGFSKGNGTSGSFSGPNTSIASGHGAHGSGSRTGFKNHQDAARNNWANYIDSKGRAKQVSNNWASHEAQKNQALGRSAGHGYSASLSDRKNSGASGHGKKGTDVQSDFNNDYKQAKDNWSRVKIGKNWKNTRDNWDDKGRTATQSKAQALHDANASTRSDYHGSRNDAHGRRASRSGSRHKNQ